MDCRPRGSSVHGIFQASILVLVTPFFREPSQPRNWTRASSMTGRHFTVWATREAGWVLLCCSVSGTWRASLSGFFLCWSAGTWGERDYSDGSIPLHVTQQYHPASMTTWLSSKVIPLCDLLPHVTGGHLPAVNSRPHPGIAPQSLHSSSQPPWVLEDLHSCLGYIWMQQGSSVGFSLHSDCHRSIAALSNSLKCFPASQTMPQCRDLTPASVPSPSKYGSSPASSPLFHFLPLSYQVLCGSTYSFPGVRYSCLLSAGILKDLYLKMHSWNICGDVLHVYHSSAILSSPLHRIIIHRIISWWL